MLFFNPSSLFNMGSLINQLTSGRQPPVFAIILLAALAFIFNSIVLILAAL